MTDNEQQYVEVQVIPGTPPPSLLPLQIPSLHGVNITCQQNSPLWSGDTNDSFGFDLTQFADDQSFGTFTSSLTPTSPSSSAGYSPLLDSFQDFSINNSSPVVASPLNLDGADVGLPVGSYEHQFTWPPASHKNSGDYLSPPGIFAPSPQRSFHSPSSSFSELSSDAEQSSSTGLVRRHSHSIRHNHSMSQGSGLDQLRLDSQQLPLRRTRSISVVRSRSPYDRQDTSDEYFLPSPSRSPAPPFPEPEIPDFGPSPQISITTASDDSDESQTTPSGSGTRETIASVAVLRASEKRRTKKANFKCPICGNALTSKDNLNNHIDAHNNVRRHTCDHCGDRFRTRSVLRRHQGSNKCKSRVKVNSFVGKIHC